jgi:hypothetical protein
MYRWGWDFHVKRRSRAAFLLKRGRAQVFILTEGIQFQIRFRCLNRCWGRCIQRNMPE